MHPGNRDADYGRSDLCGPNSGLCPSGSDGPTAQDADTEKLRKLQSEYISDKFNKDDELDSRSKPVTSPENLMSIDLLHSRVGDGRYASGAVGGYTPASPDNRRHPLWSINGGSSTRFDASDRTNLADAGALGVDALDVAALDVRSAPGLGTASFDGLDHDGSGDLDIGDLGGLYRGSAAGGGFDASGLSGSANTSGGTTSLTGANGTGGAAGAAGKTGASGTSGGSGAAGQPGMGGFIGADVGVGAGGSEDDKKGRRREYEASKFEDDEDGALSSDCVSPISQTYGSDEDLGPASQKDGGWDPRRW